jgi:hypothetical protein
MAEQWKKGTFFEWEGLRLKAQDDEICRLLADAALFEQCGTASLKTAMQIAIACGRITLADLPVPVGKI